MEISRYSPLCTVLTAAMGGYAVTATTAQALEAEDWFIKSTAFPEVFHMTKDTGAIGVALLMNCLALGITLWSTAVGIKLATGVSGLLRKLGLKTLAMTSVGPLVALGASGAGALLGTAAGSLLVWGKQGLLIGLGVVLLVSCIIMWPFTPAALTHLLEGHGLLMKQLMVFLIIQFIVMFLGVVLSFVHPGAYILMLIMKWAFVGLEPTRQCALAQKLLRHLPGQMPDSGDFLVCSFCMLVSFSGFGTGTVAFCLSLRENPQQSTRIILLSCAHTVPLCASIIGAVLGIYSMLWLKTKDAEKVALGAAGTTIFALKGVSAALDSLGPSGTAGLLTAVGSIAGLSVESAVVAAKMRYHGPGAAGALLGVLGGAILGTVSLSVARKILLLSITAVVAVIPNLERIKQMGYGDVGDEEVKPLESAVEGAVFFGLVALATGAIGLAVILIGLTGTTGFVIVIVVNLVAIIYFFKFTN